jgi:hypothetical protein
MLASISTCYYPTYCCYILVFFTYSLHSWWLQVSLYLKGICCAACRGVVAQLKLRSSLHSFQHGALLAIKQPLAELSSALRPVFQHCENCTCTKGLTAQGCMIEVSMRSSCQRCCCQRFHNHCDCGHCLCNSAVMLIIIIIMLPNQAIASMPSAPRPFGAEGRGTAPLCLQLLRTSQACTRYSAILLVITRHLPLLPQISSDTKRNNLVEASGNDNTLRSFSAPPADAHLMIQTAYRHRPPGLAALAH